MSCIRLIFQGSPPSQDHRPDRVTKKKGHSFCECNQRKAVGVVALVAASVLILFAILLASGVLGGGQMAFIAGGLSIASMVGYGLAAYLFLSEPKTDPLDKTLYHSKKKAKEESYSRIT